MRLLGCCGRTVGKVEEIERKGGIRTYMYDAPSRVISDSVEPTSINVPEASQSIQLQRTPSPSAPAHSVCSSSVIRCSVPGGSQLSPAEERRAVIQGAVVAGYVGARSRLTRSGGRTGVMIPIEETSTCPPPINGCDVLASCRQTIFVGVGSAISIRMVTLCPFSDAWRVT